MTRKWGVAAILAIALAGLANARGPPVEGPADACQACLMSVRILEDFLCDPAATDFLVGFVEKKVCPRMGDTAQCHNLAEGLLPTIIQWFRVSATPASLCSSSGVCGAEVLQVAPLNRPALRVRGATECALCKFVVRTVQEQLENSQALEQIKEIALQMCGELPDELAAVCTDFVSNYWSTLAELVESMDPETVCGLMGSCVEMFAAVPPPPLPPALMQALAGSQLLRRMPPPPVLSAFMGLPPPLFGPPGGMMGMMMPHGGPGMGMGMMRPARDQQSSTDDGKALERDQNGNGKPTWTSMMSPANGGPMGPFNNDGCDYCKMAVIEAHSLVSSPQVQAEVRNYTKAMCNKFPAIAEPCKMYVDMYAPLVFTLLEEYLVPELVCAQTGLCPPPSAQGSGAASFMGHKARSWTCWLLDGWLGDVLRHVGLGGLLPPHHEHGHGEEPMHHYMQPERQLTTQ